MTIPSPMPDVTQLERAIALACKVHAGQRDKSGQAYILHPLTLMLQFQDDEARIVSVLHDVVEDGGVSFDALRELGLSEAIVEAIDCLSKRPGEAYDAFIARIAPNPLARMVKIADIRHNLDVTRMAVLQAKDLERIAKYHKALLFLDRLGPHAARQA